MRRSSIVFLLVTLLAVPLALTSCGDSGSPNVTAPPPQSESPAEFDLLTVGHVLTGVWGDGINDVFVCGERGLILHNGGNGWEIQITPILFDDLVALWGSSATNVWAVGQSGVILHYDGVDWTQSVSGTSVDLRDVWGASASPVWAVGPGGTILKYTNASGWVEINSPISASINAIYGNAADNIFAAAEAGTLLAYDGSTWNVEKAKNSNGTDTFSPLRDVWMAPNGDAFFAVDSYSIVTRKASGLWGILGTGQTQNIYGVWGTSDTDIYGVGQLGLILHYNGASWPKETSGAGTTSLVGVWGANTDDVYTVGGDGKVIHRDNSAWTPQLSGRGSRLKTMWGTSANNLHIVGQDGVTYHYDGSAFEVGVLPVNTDYHDSWGFAGNNIYAVSSVGMIHFNGTAWQVETSQGPLYGIWGAAPNDIVAVGPNGYVTRYNGSTWNAAPSIGTETLNGISGIDAEHMYVVASGGKVFELGAAGVTNSWLPASTGTSADLYDAWAASTSDVFIVGSSGTILRFNGTSFTPMTSGVVYSLYAVWGTSGSDVWATGGLGTVLHYNGSSWTVTELNTSMTAQDVFGFSPSEVFVSMDRGTLLKLK